MSFKDFSKVKLKIFNVYRYFPKIAVLAQNSQKKKIGGYQNVCINLI